MMQKCIEKTFIVGGGVPPLLHLNSRLFSKYPFLKRCSGSYINKNLEQLLTQYAYISAQYYQRTKSVAEA